MKYRIFLLFLCLMASLVIQDIHAAEKKVTFVHVNDVYELQPRHGLGGVAFLGSLLREYRKKDPQLVFTFGGDLLSPSLLSGWVQGQQMIEAMNGLGLSVAVPGNHEFDFGPENMLKQIGASQAVWLAANMGWITGEGMPGIKSHLVREINGIKVGFFGLITPDTAISSKPGRQVRFDPVLDTARKEVAELKSQGAMVIVALTHQFLSQDRQLAKEVKGIDLILGGHDHDPMALYEHGVLILKSGSDNQFMGVVELVAQEGQPGQPLIWRPSWQMRPVSGVAADPALSLIVEGWSKRLDESLGMPLLTVSIPFNSLEGEVRTQENSMGNMITDVMREAVGADVALFNGGGLRGNRVYPVGYVLTAKDILTEMPFGNVTVLLRLSGRDLLSVLESALGQVELGAGRFPQVSGLRVTYDPEQPAGKRVMEVRVGENLLELDRPYKVATTDYLFSGKDGYDALSRGQLLIDSSGATLVATQVKEWLLAHQEWKPRLEGRVVRRKP
ncbi:MAG: 5'-nucleotidase C-terminal domain-containing protein [Magnetococcus sp. YQC-5]